VESHQPIVEALEKGRGEEAGLLLRDHVKAFLEYLRRADGGESSAESQRDSKEIDGVVMQRQPSMAYRGGLGPARLRRVTGLVQAKIEE
jgi:hypothetical protein